MNFKQVEPTRREALTLAAVAGLAAFLAPKMLLADEAAVATEIKKLYGDKKMESGKIKLDVPEIAENGLVVPINIDVESPMTDSGLREGCARVRGRQPAAGCCQLQVHAGLRQGIRLDAHAPRADPEHRLHR